jgi:thioester reductase-like protein
MLLERGFDAPCGMTQLGPIAAAAEGGAKECCPRARDVFDRILYLPVTNPNFSRVDEERLIRALEEVVSAGTGENVADDANNGFIHPREHARRSTQPRPIFLRRKNRIIFFSLLIEWCFSAIGLFDTMPLRIMLRLAVLIGPWMGAASVFLFLSLLALSQYMGPIYLKSSDAFAKYCGMVFRSPFHDQQQDAKSETTQEANEVFLQSRTIMELESTKIPSLVTSDEENATSDNVDENESQSQTIALLTGATGFIGSLLLREVLLHRHSLSLPGGVAVVVRSKRGKSAKERMDRLLSQSMFDFLSQCEKKSLIHVVEGDVTLPDCGMGEIELRSLCEMDILHVFHCAAAVSFSQPLKDAAVSNITSTLQLFQMTQRLNSGNTKDARVKFVYISTAFVHGGNTGTSSEPLDEELFSLHPYDPVELYKSMLGSQSYASAAMAKLGFPNTYTFSKCVCEHLLLEQETSEGGSCIIIRPSIVGPSVQEPSEGWAGDKPSTIVAAACLYLKFPYNMWCFGKETVPFVPVDVVCRFVISRSFGNNARGLSRNIVESDADSLSEADEKKYEMIASDIVVEERNTSRSGTTIATVAWDASSPATSSFSWISYAFSITHLGAVCGHVHRVVAYAGLLLSTKLFPWLNLSMDTYKRLHYFFVRAPLGMVVDLCDRLSPLLNPGIVRDLRTLTSIIDLPLLFFPFANQSFYFKSSLVAPSDFNGERYMFSCAVAAHEFIRMIEKQRRDKRSSRSNIRQLNESNLRVYGGGEAIGGREVLHHNDSSSIIVAGANHAKPKSDLLWALTQPRGNLAIRFGGWILAKVFRHTAMEVEIDVASFEALSRAISLSGSSSKSNATPRVVIIAPTHRSFYDFLIVSYICFTLPELGLDIPHIAAASDFASIPIIGWREEISCLFRETGGW